MAAQRHQSHQRPPLDAADHLSSLFCFGFFFFFSFFLFPVHFFWLWFDGWVRMGRLVVGGFELWVMAMGGLRCADRWWVGSVPISIFGGGADLCYDMFLSLFFYFGGGFGSACGLIWWLWSGFFFFFLVIVAATIFLVVVVAAAAVVFDDDDDVGGI